VSWPFPTTRLYVIVFGFASCLSDAPSPLPNLRMCVFLFRRCWSSRSCPPHLSNSQDVRNCVWNVLIVLLIPFLPIPPQYVRDRAWALQYMVYRLVVHSIRSASRDSSCTSLIGVSARSMSTRSCCSRKSVVYLGTKHLQRHDVRCLVRTCIMYTSVAALLTVLTFDILITFGDEVSTPSKSAMSMS
jgi:hypothetical protein